MPITILSVLRLAALRPVKPTILIVEPNVFHSETLPGYWHQFKGLGYEVVVACRQAHLADSAFCRVDAPPLQLAFDPIALRWVLGRPWLKRFELLFLSSRHVFDNDVHIWGCYLGSLQRAPCTKRGCISMEHQADDGPAARADEERRVAKLLPPPTGLPAKPWLTPLYFGSPAPSSVLNGRGTRRFVVVGRYAIYRDTLGELFALLHTRDLASKIEVLVIGDAAQRHIGDVPACVRLVGRLPFAQMFNVIDAAHFFLPLWSSTCAAHDRYLRDVCSGSRQLILGFGAVPLVEHAFAQRYGFDDTCAICHAPGALSEALDEALQMSEAHHASMRLQLAALARDTAAASLEQLRALCSDGPEPKAVGGAML